VPSTETIITSFLAIALIAFIVSQKLKQPYTLVLVFTGIFLAAFSISSFTGVNTIYNQLVAGGLFVGIVLPPLLFESMMDITSSEFRAVARSALSLATFGVFVATALTGFFFWKVVGLPFYPSFLFAALISPTDTATVLEVFKRVRVPRKLATMMETESAFNDATGIALFAFILTSMDASRLSISSALTDFLWIFLGGVFVGLGVAVASRLLLRVLNDPIAESILTLTAVYGSYSVATVLGVSGLVAVSTTGITYGVIWATDEPRRHRETLRNFWMILAFLANSIAFLAIGLATSLSEIITFILPIMIAYSVVLGARFISVYSILAFVKIDRLKVPNSWKAVATLGGARGAISIVLASSLPATLEDVGLIRTVVLGIAFLSIVIQGYLLSRYSKRKFANTSRKRIEPRPEADRSLSQGDHLSQP
jgi:CPA1 family monovalent cation:H+ antiporter